ncbi:MAG TPA: hypothetical protein VHO73_09670 [Methylomirabilota bacterium]|nr:hypothetical protein [Methylomirabilota bacterium]
MRDPGRAAGPSRRDALSAALVALGLGLGHPRAGWAQTVPPPPARPRPPAQPAAPGLPAAPAAPAPPATDPRPGAPAPREVVEEIRTAIAHAVTRFEARDAEGVLAHVSEEYWTGPLGKRAIRAQLLTILQVHQQVRARVELDEVRLVGAHAWVWTTGDMTGQLALVGQWVRLFVWQKELEVARRERGVWRLYGYQQ